MATQVIKEETPAAEQRQKPITPKDLIEAKVGSKNTIYTAIKSGEIETFRLCGKICIAPAWVREKLDW